MSGGFAKVFNPITSNVREFLARALAWPQEGEPASYVNVHWGYKFKDRSGKDAVTFPGKACLDVREAASTIDWAAQSQTDIYIGMASSDTFEAKTSRNNKPYKKAVRLREHAYRYKSLFIDVDVKPDQLAKGYATTEDALKEFTRIRIELGLPRPSFVIMSGSGGFHAHWTFVEPIGVERWQKLSLAFCAGVVAKGFRGDTQCIIDFVRLLRPPGTLNWKGGTAKPVTQLGNTGPDYFVDVLEAALQPFVGVYASTAVSKPKMLGLGPVPAALAALATIGSVAPLDAGVELNQYTIDEVATGCPFIARTLADGGAGNNNPLWLQTTNIALFCQEARDATHDMSSGHPTYNVADTDALFDRQLTTKQQRNLGWPRCQTIAGYGAPECQTCPNFAKGQSPLNFAVRPVQQLLTSQPTGAGSVPAGVTAAPVIPAATLAPLPTGYGYDAQGFACVITTDDNGVQIYEPVCTFALDKPWLQLDPPVLNFTTATHAGHERQIRAPYEMIVDKNGLAKGLAKQGMIVKLNQISTLGNFFVSFIEKMRADRDNVVQSQPFGWTTKDGKLAGFVYGGHVWSKNLPRPSANPDPVLVSQYSPQGDLTPWTVAAKMLTDQERPAIDAILASAFAAPLVRFTGQSGLLMSTWSLESGIGKSTAIKIAQAVWGHPQKAVQSLSDTVNAVLKKIGDTKNLPLFWDELKTDEDTQRFMNLAFQLSQGKEKSRLASDTSYRDPGTWQTMLCSSSNNSLLSFILDHTKTTTAGLYRVFEFYVPVGTKGQISPADAQLITAELNDNYGHAGLRYAQFLGEHHERVAREVAELSRALERRFNIAADERFWLALMCVIMSGAKYANELKLTQIDERKLAQFLVARLNDMRAHRATTTVDVTREINVLGVLARFLNEHRRAHTVITNQIHRGPGRPPAWAPGAQAQGTINLSGLTNMQTIRSVMVHIGEADHWCRIGKNSFSKWLQEEGMAPSTICDQLVTKFGVRLIRARMCAGTALATAQEELLEFNYADPVFQDLIEL